jgi:hypothetical protein
MTAAGASITDGTTADKPNINYVTNATELITIRQVNVTATNRCKLTMPQLFTGWRSITEQMFIQV